MNLKSTLAFIAVFAAAGAVTAQQGSGYLITQIPIGTVQPDSVVWVQWIGSSRNPLDPTYPAPDTGYIFYSRSPGGGKLANYRNRVTRPWIDSAGGVLRIHANEYTHPTPADPVARRATAFRPSQQTDMSAGVFYCVVALPLANDTFVSNEFQIMVESPTIVERIAPAGSITELTPSFRWNVVPGVPYYHLILSDEPIKWDSSSGKIDLSGLSVVWQAITPGNQIVYGVPDPSKTITADPPPLSPGTTYNWVVLSNYGNHPAFSSYRSTQLPPGVFAIAGTGLKRPVNTYPANKAGLNSTQNRKFSFKWTNIDAKANTYKIYVYVSADFSSLFDGVSANPKMAVWQSEVRAAAAETLSVSIDAATILTNNAYIWRVIAIDDKGAGTAGDTSSFTYSSPVGTMQIHTRENVVTAVGGKLDTVITTVGLVQIQVEVLDGSLEAPILFFTDTKGDLNRQRPTGTYRITTVKDGFLGQSKTVVLGENATVNETFFLERPESQVFGRVMDESNAGLNLASVRGISDRYDTVNVKSDGLGNFVMNCYGADWLVDFEMAGYKPVLPRKITVKPGESYDFGAVTMEKNPYTLSGVVKNGDGQPLLGATVRILHDGAPIDDVPSTPQNGAFSFTVPAGTYRLQADRTGFSSWSGSVDMVSSKNVTIVLQPAATCVTGFVYRRSKVGGNEVLSPIRTGVSIIFVKIGTADTIAGTFNEFYGNYTANLAAGQRYAVYGSSADCAPQAHADTLTTTADPNIPFNDTLQAYALVPGVVRLSSTRAALVDVAVSLVNLVSKVTAATARSAADGYFELGGIPDGHYAIHAGKDGLTLDSIQGPDTLDVTNGTAGRDSIAVFMKAGNKTITWVVQSSDRLSGRIKVLSPIVKTILFTDSISRAGPGDYTIAAVADADTLLECAQHRFTVPQLAVVYTDTVALNVVHRNVAAVQLVNGRMSLEIHSKVPIDSAVLYYKEASGTSWLSSRATGQKPSDTFSIAPPFDGSTLQYYFTAFRGSDVYGTIQQTFYTQIRPDLSTLSKFEIVPWSADTLHLPASCEVTFLLKGYYGASFLRANNLDSQAVLWSLSAKGGCELTKSRGLSAVVRTAASRMTAPAVLTATIDASRIALKTGLGPTLSVMLIASGNRLRTIRVRRVDANNKESVSTSLSDRAEFLAEGLDSAGTVLSLTPAWSIAPANAGTISADGSYTPARNFIGTVHVSATAGAVRGEYVPDGGLASGTVRSGLNVHHLISAKPTADTITNLTGLSIVLPPRALSGSDIGELQLLMPEVKNRIRYGGTAIHMVDSSIYDISELKKVSLNTAADSIRLRLAIPYMFQKDAAEKRRPFWIARWNTDSLQWDPLASSAVAADGKSISVGILHFSQYTVVTRPSQLSVDFSASPNPFSPRIRPRGGSSPFLGTCISVKLDMPETSLQYFEVRIYNLIGDLIWGVQVANATAKTYEVWWDGTTTERIEPWRYDASQTVVHVKGTNMCRNGRYFAVLIVKDFNNKETKYMKQIILMK